MVFVSISFHHRTPLVELEGNLTARYISNVLDEHIFSFFEQHPYFLIFQGGSARTPPQLAWNFEYATKESKRSNYL